VSVRRRVWTTRDGTRKEAWIADFTDGAGKRHIRTFQQKKKADAYEAKIRVDVGLGTHLSIGADRSRRRPRTGSSAWR
jgi:integrase